MSLEEGGNCLDERSDSLAMEAGVERLGIELLREIREFRREVKAFRMMMVAGLGFLGMGLATLQIVLHVVA